MSKDWAIGFAAGCLALAAATAAHAQLGSFAIEMTPAEAARGAFEQPYGKALVAEAGKVFRDSADASCLARHAIDTPQLEAKAREIFVRDGTKMFEIYLGTIDVVKFEAEVEKRAGPGAQDEMARLRSYPEVAEFMKLSAPAGLAGAADLIVENFDRYLLIWRLKLRRSISPLSSGDQRLLKLRDEIDDSVERLLAENSSLAVSRYHQLTEIVGQEISKAADRKAALQIGPTTFFRGVENDLRAVCVVPGDARATGSR